jgi:hypothetical protein
MLPPKKARYEGIRGSTQGEKNDKRPAAKLIHTEISFIISSVKIQPTV